MSIQKSGTSGIWLALTDDGGLWLGRLDSFDAKGEIHWNEVNQYEPTQVED